MSLQEFENDDISRRQKGIRRMRSIRDVGMGILWIGMATYIFFIKYFSPGLQVRYDDVYMKIISALFALYGAFRIYRGLKKDYFIER